MPVVLLLRTSLSIYSRLTKARYNFRRFWLLPNNTTDDSNTNAAVVGATTDAASNKRKTETEMPLDLTCV